jgi:D-sedoheptulose 7-phosphate isomerase
MSAVSGVASAVAAREGPSAQLAAQAEGVAEAARDMAARFAAGGRLYAFGPGRAEPDAQHVSVEFVHPVIVGKRALPATALTGGRFDQQIRLFGAPGDIALGISPGGPGGPDEGLRAGLEAASEMGLLTVVLAGGPGSRAGWPVEHCLGVDSDDPLVVAELQVTTYHILWELVHVFLEAVP